MAIRTLREIIIKMAYPKGSVYMTTNSDMTLARIRTYFPDPEGKLTWQQMSGRMLMHAPNDATTLGQTGGFLRTQLITHTHSLSTTNSGHKHTQVAEVVNKMHSSGSGVYYVHESTNHSGSAWVNTSSGTHSHNFGSSGTAPNELSNLPPFRVVHMYKRVAV